MSGGRVPPWPNTSEAPTLDSAQLPAAKAHSMPFPFCIWPDGTVLTSISPSTTAAASGPSTRSTTPPSNSVTINALTNRITDTGYAYDLAGNMTNDGSNTLTYDAENRVTNSANGGSAGAYVFDGSQLLATLTGPPASATPSYHIADHLSPRVTTDSTGTVVGQQAHFPF